MRARRFLLLIDLSTTYCIDNDLGKGLYLIPEDIVRIPLRFCAIAMISWSMALGLSPRGPKDSCLDFKELDKNRMSYMVFHPVLSGSKKLRGLKSATFFSSRSPGTLKGPIMYPSKSLNIALAFHSAFT